ncbi:MAG: hypothetical protein UT34_C0002G0039 [candidate division WS6 bacterium GW2011_GWF2_39_15]|uniref:Methyltransferase type 11 domain-containing protein n=1 Tax=candidate division WS6 bacterium GW2011_GWF2_39_15 TaxID=1619100 RepID=A0A0G0QV55_9BACT|nr:MAG: hypothetical protein UT34_C0002G0039 [candidate division WS6 bacterium GW2011_GWF2_39_15]
MKVSDYDQYKYDYKEYWKDRSYENDAERHLLRKTFAKLKGDWFIDIGGSFGRNLDLYYSKYEHPVILDYSLLTLQKNQSEILKTFPNTILIAANAYNLPFRDNSFDGGLMVRVLHHINKPEAYFKELKRVMSQESIYIQEFANKIHIKAALKNLLKPNLSFFSTEPYQQPTHGNHEGTKGEDTYFLNFHPKHIRRLLEENSFVPMKKCGVSYFRIPFLKKHLPNAILRFFETFMQLLLGWTSIAPSIFFISKKINGVSSQKAQRLEDILICPKCNGSLQFTEERAQCVQCKTIYRQDKGIWDFRA